MPDRSRPVEPGPSPVPGGLPRQSFAVTGRTRPFALVAPGAALIEETGPRVPGSGRSEQAPPAPYAAVEIRVAELGGHVAAGVAVADGDAVWVRLTARSLSVEVRAGGRTRVLRRRRMRTVGPIGLAFVLCENQVTALVDTGAGWRAVLTERAKIRRYVDLRHEESLTRYRYAWDSRGGRLSSVRAGVFGMAGLRDPHLVQHADGAPYERDGRRYLTWTAAGLGFFPQAHWTVWSFDPVDPADQRLEAHLFSRRGGRVLGDHAGQLVRDGDRWLIAVSAWGDFGEGPVHVRHATSRADLLTGVHVLDTEPVDLPTAHRTWDPSLVRTGEGWTVAYVESPSQEPFDFHPALARTPDADWTRNLSPVFAATDLHQCEGPVLVRLDGHDWLLTSDGHAHRYRVFDLAGHPAGDLDAPYPTNIPHPQLVPDPRGGWWLVTFDGTPLDERTLGYGGHGDVVLMHSEPAPANTSGGPRPGRTVGP